MESAYEAVVLGPGPRESPAHPPLAKVRAFEAMAAHAGMASERLPIAVRFGDDRHHPFSGAFQQGCANLGRCDTGCPRMSRNTVDITHVARAESHDAEVYPLHEAPRTAAPASAGGAWRSATRSCS